jgi:hypothetical protein
MFEKMLGYANHLGLFAEETGLSGQALGNFPQAFSHLGLISAAYNLDRALDGHTLQAPGLVLPPAREEPDASALSPDAASAMQQR